MPPFNQTGQPDDRLQREIDEILDQARSRPISFQQRVAQKRTAIQQQRQVATPGVSGWAKRIGQLIVMVPIITAVILAMIGAYLAPDHDVIAFFFGLAAVVMVFLPFAVRGRPATSTSRYQPRWRGRVVSNLPPVPSSRQSSLIDNLKRRFGR